MSFFHFNVIPSFECHFVILMSFHHLNVIPSFECHSIIWMTFHHLNVISLAISQGGNIQSFGCHSIHPIVIWGVEMTGDENILEWQEWWWNDVLIIWNTFPSFLSSQMSGQNWGNCRFHPCHPESSHHSSVIQKFWINGKMPQMTSEWRMIFGYVWPLSLFKNKIISEIVSTACFSYPPTVESSKWTCMMERRPTAATSAATQAS